ncbi:MAG TPA: GldM family protein [Saprospiraceae bacterium]|nr:GldM family protein [Saprospiraceae bacterium]
MIKMLLSLLVLLCFGAAQGQDYSCRIKTSEGRTLYIHTENKFEIDESGFGREGIHVETNNGEIQRFSKGKYMIKPNSMGDCVISIYNKEKSKKIHSELFFVVYSVQPVIIPVFYSQEYQMTDNEIPIDRLEDLRGFSTMVYSRNQIIFLVEEMKLIIRSKKKGEFEFVTNGNLSKEIKAKINSLDKGDLILLKNIMIKSVTDYERNSTPDQIFKIQPTVYFVK